MPVLPPLSLLKHLLNPKLLAAVLGVALAIGAAWWTYSTIKDAGYQQAKAEYELKLQALNTMIQKERAMAKEAAAAAEAMYWEREAHWAARVKSTQETYNAKIKQDSVVLAALRAEHARSAADAERVRDDIAAFAAGRGGSAEDSCATASERATALGVLLAEAISIGDEALLVATEAAEAAESSGAAVRAVLDAWPDHPH